MLVSAESKCPSQFAPPGVKRNFVLNFLSGIKRNIYYVGFIRLKSTVATMQARP